MGQNESPPADFPQISRRWFQLGATLFLTTTATSNCFCWFGALKGPDFSFSAAGGISVNERGAGLQGGWPPVSLSSLSSYNSRKKAAFWEKHMSGGKLQGFSSDLALGGLSTDEATSTRKGKPHFWQVFWASGLQGDTFHQGEFLRRPEKYWVGFFGQTLLAL